MNIIKVLKNDKINRWNGLTRNEAYNLEKECLICINNNFECLCKIKQNHFPKLIDFDDEKYQFVLSNCGICIKEYNKSKKKNIIIANKKEQVNCIIENLKKMNIIHLDMSTNGKNMCITEDGIISIIDFDIAIINNNSLSEQITKLYNQYTIKDNYYDNIRKKILKIVNKSIKKIAAEIR